MTYIPTEEGSSVDWDYVRREIYNNWRMTWQDAYKYQPMDVCNVLVFVQEQNDLWLSQYIDIDCYDYKNFWWCGIYKSWEVKYWMPLPEFPNK